MSTRSPIRYRELIEDITTDIRRGVYPVGHDLPTEAQFCDRYGVSRFTVREALRRLDSSGLIVRHQGRGSRVISRSATASYTLVAQSEADVLRYTEDTCVYLNKREKKVSARAAGMLGLTDPAKWFCLSGMRRALDDERPVAVLEVYALVAHRAALELLETPVASAIFPRIVEHEGLHLTRIEQRISAVALDPRAARQLSAEPGSPGLQIIRTFSAEEADPFEVSISVHPAEHFEFALSVEPHRH